MWRLFSRVTLRFIQTQARVELLNKLNGEAVFGITWMADRYDEEKYERCHFS